MMSAATGLRTLLVLALLLPITAAAPLTIRAEAIIAVTTTADDLTVNGNCTLREAVIAANTDAAVDACPAGAGADTIILPAGTYALQLPGLNEDSAQTGDLDILSDLSIQGAGPGLTVIDGNDLDRVVHVIHPTAHVTIRGVALLNGDVRPEGASRCGGGIYNAGALTLDTVDVSQNSAYIGGGLCNAEGASINLTDSTIRENQAYMNGGGIHNRGFLAAHRVVIGANLSTVDAGGLFNRNPGNAVITRSRIEANQARYEEGGGMINTGMMQIAESTLSGNHAGWFGGAIINTGDLTLTDSLITGNWGGFTGGGICNCTLFDYGGSVTMTATNSTITGNFADDGSAIANEGTATLTHSTIQGTLSHWGGLSYETTGVTYLRASIAPVCDSPVISQGYNLDTGDTCGLAGPGDLSNTDPRLGPLVDNGGPTHTVALLPGSPAIDAIPAAECNVAADQRGMARPQPRKESCDIGAYEFGPQAESGWIIEDVKQLYAAGALDNTQKRVLISQLKTVELGLMKRNPVAACANLDAFAAQLNTYATTGKPTPGQAQLLLDAAQRIRALICN